MIGRYTPKDIAEVFSEDSKFKRFLEIEILVCQALGRLGLIPKTVSQNIRKKAKISVEKIKKIEEKTHHDVVAFVLNLSESLGKDAQYIHFGLTSSDLLDTTLAWQIKDSLRILLKDLEALIREVKKKALKYRDTICVGRTHGVWAEVYSFGLKFAFFYDELIRIEELLKNSEKFVCCGKISGAVGSFVHIPPKVEEFVCKKIGISYAKISSQIISRDRFAYFLSLLALLGSVIERFSTEIRHLQKSEVKEVEEPFYKGQKGSSAMPHKRNPIICERVSGLARLLRANMLAGFENINLWHERDISHSSVERVIIPDSIILTVYILRKFKEVIKGLLVYPENMLKNLRSTQGLVYSQALLLKLMRKGLRREEAYDLVQRVSFKVIKNNSDFKEEVLKDREVTKYLDSEEIKTVFLPQNYLKNIDLIYRRLDLL